MLLVLGCATEQKVGDLQKGESAYIEESWGYYGLALFFCSVLRVDDWTAPEPGWTNARLDRIALSPGVHEVNIKCKSKVYPGVRHRYLHTFTLLFEEGHKYKVELSLRKGCVFISDVTKNVVIADDGHCSETQ